MDNEKRRLQSEIAIKEKSIREQHNQSIAHGIYWHGLFRWFGEAKPKQNKLPQKKTVFKWRSK